VYLFVIEVTVTRSTGERSWGKSLSWRSPQPQCWTFLDYKGMGEPRTLRLGFWNTTDHPKNEALTEKMRIMRNRK
jgi:hypothetical protein